MRHYPTRDLKADWRPGDAAKLARLYNESGPGWPGGFGSSDATPEEVGRNFRDRDLLAAFVAEADDRFVAYCDLSARPGDRHAVIPLLDAHPDYHDRGFGKAVLLSAVERAIELGFDQVWLGTWPGNLKAVPLYKKSGFMWAPESEVTMESFVPFALRHPLARPFFDQHDWYATQVRDLALREDAYMHGKVRAYQYLWRAEGDMLRMVFDRQSWGLLEIETNDLRAGCFLPDEKIVAGLPQVIRWEIERKHGAPFDVVIVARPDPGISCSHQECLRVAGRESRSAEFLVDPEIREKEQEPYAQIIGSALLIDGQPLELAAGMEVRQAAAVGVEPDSVPLRPGAEQRMFLHVASNLDHKARATVAVHCARGARMKRQTASVDLNAHERHRFPITLTPGKAGQVAVIARVDLKTRGRAVRTKDTPIALAALGPSGIVGTLDEQRVELCSERLCVRVDRGGWMHVLHRSPDRGHPPLRSLVELRSPALGPPFAWQEFFTRPKFDASVEQRAGAAVAVVRSDSAQRPGMMLERRIILTQRPVVEIHDRIVNTTAAAAALSVLRGGWPGGHTTWTAMPGPQGMLQGAGGGAAFEPGDFRPSEEGADWPEGWRCFGTRQGVTGGLIWAQAERVEHGGLLIQQPLDRLTPGAAVDAPPFYVFAGEGDAATVRSWWAALCAPEQAVVENPETPIAPPLTFGLEPTPLVVPPSGADARAFVRSFGRRKLKGRLDLRMPPGLRVDQRSHAFEGLTGEKALETAVRVTPVRGGGGMRVGRAELSLPEVVYTSALPVLGLPAVEPEEREENGALVLDADPLRLQVDPSFCGCAVSLRFRGREMLHTRYPEHPPFMWWNPWFGGIWPQMDAWPSALLPRERFTGRFISKPGRSGVAWRGVAVSCSPRHEQLRHIRLRFEYLLLPGAPVLAVRVCCANRLRAATQFGIGAQVWLSLGGKPTDAVTVRRADEPGAVRRRQPEHAGISATPWGVVENPRARCAVLLACGAPRTTLATAELAGRDGYHLEARSGGLLQPGGSSAALFYLAFGASMGEVEPYRHLAGCVDLP